MYEDLVCRTGVLHFNLCYTESYNTWIMLFVYFEIFLIEMLRFSSVQYTITMFKCI